MQELLDNFGLGMSTFFVMSAGQAVREQGIPFKIAMDVPNPETIKAMKETENNIEISKRFTSVEALMEDLEADDKIILYNNSKPTKHHPKHIGTCSVGIFIV